VSRRPSTRTVLVVGAVLSVLVAGVLSGWASASPDGLQQVAQALGFADSERRSATAGSPLADYSAPLASGRLSGGLAGVLGVVVVGLVMVVLLTWLRRRRPSDEER
jgi:cobalt/nickel transport protein